MICFRFVSRAVPDAALLVPAGAAHAQQLASHDALFLLAQLA